MTLATDMSILYYGNCQYMTNQKTIKKISSSIILGI